MEIINSKAVFPRASKKTTTSKLTHGLHDHVGVLFTTSKSKMIKLASDFFLF